MNNKIILFDRYRLRPGEVPLTNPELTKRKVRNPAAKIKKLHDAIGDPKKISLDQEQKLHEGVPYNIRKSRGHKHWTTMESSFETYINQFTFIHIGTVSFKNENILNARKVSEIIVAEIKAGNIWEEDRAYIKQSNTGKGISYLVRKDKLFHFLQKYGKGYYLEEIETGTVSEDVFICKDLSINLNLSKSIFNSITSFLDSDNNITDSVNNKREELEKILLDLQLNDSQKKHVIAILISINDNRDIILTMTSLTDLKIAKPKNVSTEVLKALGNANDVEKWENNIPPLFDIPINRKLSDATYVYSCKNKYMFHLLKNCGVLGLRTKGDNEIYLNKLSFSTLEISNWTDNIDYIYKDLGASEYHIKNSKETDPDKVIIKEVLLGVIDKRNYVDAWDFLVKEKFIQITPENDDKAIVIKKITRKEKNYLSRLKLNNRQIGMMMQANRAWQEGVVSNFYIFARVDGAGNDAWAVDSVGFDKIMLKYDLEYIEDYLEAPKSKEVIINSVENNKVYRENIKGSSTETSRLLNEYIGWPEDTKEVKRLVPYINNQNELKWFRVTRRLNVRRKVWVFDLIEADNVNELAAILLYEEKCKKAMEKYDYPLIGSDESIVSTSKPKGISLPEKNLLLKDIGFAEDYPKDKPLPEYKGHKLAIRIFVSEKGSSFVVWALPTSVVEALGSNVQGKVDMVSSAKSDAKSALKRTGVTDGATTTTTQSRQRTEPDLLREILRRNGIVFNFDKNQSPLVLNGERGESGAQGEEASVDPNYQRILADRDLMCYLQNRLLLSDLVSLKQVYMSRYDKLKDSYSGGGFVSSKPEASINTIEELTEADLLGILTDKKILEASGYSIIQITEINSFITRINEAPQNLDLYAECNRYLNAIKKDWLKVKYRAEREAMLEHKDQLNSLLKDINKKYPQNKKVSILVEYWTYYQLGIGNKEYQEIAADKYTEDVVSAYLEGDSSIFGDYRSFEVVNKIKVSLPRMYSEILKILAYFGYHELIADIERAAEELYI